MAGIDQHCIPVHGVPALRRISFQVPTAIGSFALASDPFASAPLQMVIIGQLLLYCYVTNAEDADRSFPIYQPLLGFAVGLAGVVDETSPVPLVLGINDFMSTEVHEVSVPLIHGIVYSTTFSSLSSRNHLPYVLNHKAACRNVLCCYKPPIFAPHMLNTGFNKLVALNLLILALVTAGAICWVTLMICMSVLTIVPTAVSTFTKRLALTYRNLVR